MLLDSVDTLYIYYFHPIPSPAKHKSSCSLSDRHQKLAELPFITKENKNIKRTLFGMEIASLHCQQ